MWLYLKAKTRSAHVAASDCTIQPRWAIFETTRPKERIKTIVCSIVWRAVTARVIVLEGKARSPGRVKEKTARPMQCECEMIEVDRVLSAGGRRSKLAHELKLKIKLTGRRLPQRAHARRVQRSLGRWRGTAVGFMQPKQVGFDRY